MSKAETRIAQIYQLNSPGPLARGPKKSLLSSEPAPASAVWSQSQIFAWIISRVETNVLTRKMLPKIEWAKKELIKELVKELNKMLARSVAIDRTVLEGQTPPSLCDDDGVFRISGLRTGALAHLLRIGHLISDDVRWDDIAGDPEGVKRLWPARTAAEALEVESEAPDERPDESTVGVQVSTLVQGMSETLENPPPDEQPNLPPPVNSARAVSEAPPVEQLTYEQIADRWGCSTEAARHRVARRNLPRTRGRDGKTRVAVSPQELFHQSPSARSLGGERPVNARSPGGDRPIAEGDRADAAATAPMASEWDPQLEWSVERVMQELKIKGWRQRGIIGAVENLPKSKLPKLKRYRGKTIPEILDGITGAALNRAVIEQGKPSSEDSCRKFLKAWKARRS